ncbi:uncharacterized protein LOC131671401 [Phymastichus coffea]|uniref:uncharacterized protein LOC131671401 n=1 Tax=Phymastichus coffea TaxID=108790 RepID=UPI00273C3FE3|nr:uncharacterized protein LOC131671401 [Phymastichus coffea]
MATMRFFPMVFGIVILFVNANCVKSLSDDVIVEPTKLWRFLGNNEEAVQQRFRENIEEFSVGDIECLRYCIESKTSDDASHILHLTWKLRSKQEAEMGSTAIVDKDITSQIMHEKSMMPSHSRNQCTFSIVIACEIPQKIGDNFTYIEKKFIKSLKPNLEVLEYSIDNTSPTLNFVNERIVDKSNLMNKTEVDFYVEPNQAEVSAIVLGNISQIDLKIPIHGPPVGVSTTEKSAVAAPRLTVALSRMRDNRTALRLNVLNPPPGGWRIGLEGMDMKRFVVTSSVIPEFTSSEVKYLNVLPANGGQLSALEHDDSQLSKKIGISSRQIQVEDKLEERSARSTRADDISARMIYNQMPENQERQRPFRFPKNDMSVLDPRNISIRLNTDQIEDRMIDREAIELDDFTRYLNDELPIKKYLIVELSPSTSLIANPNTIHRVTFDITNNHVITLPHYIEARSTTFRILGIRPVFGFVEIAPGQTVTVAVDVQMPPVISAPIVDTITLRVQGTESVEKTANIYVRALGSRVYDDARPDIYFYFNNNCAGRTSADKCLKSYWSVDITVQDSGSGLKSVASTPKGIYSRSQYISGTTSPVYLYYSSNCCNRVLVVTATDVSGNVYSKRIDVGVWYNLMEGEVAAIVIGTLFIILLITLIVLSILYCVNQRKSHNLPYSQRYGSRSAPSRTE